MDNYHIIVSNLLETTVYMWIQMLVSMREIVGNTHNTRW